MDAPFALPRLEGAPDPEGWIVERARYRVTPRVKPKFKTVLDGRTMFAGDCGLDLETRSRERPIVGEPALELHARVRLAKDTFDDRLSCNFDGAGVRAGRLVRRTPGRSIEIDFSSSVPELPAASYPEVLLPFLMRGQPRDGKRRACYSWTSDLFVARVYYEARGTAKIAVPAGEIETQEVWMYPDLNDWIALGNVLTTLAKPMLPRYSMWFEVARPHRVIRFEGSFGPPGAPEIVIELL